MKFVTSSIVLVAVAVAQTTTAEEKPVVDYSSFLEVNPEKTCQLDYECTLESVYGENHTDNKYYKPFISASNDNEVCCATFPRSV